MILGRNFTNTFIFDKLTAPEQEKILNGILDLFSMNAIGLVKFKEDISNQIKIAKRLGLDHIELDCDVPNPYADLDDVQCRDIKSHFEENKISSSVHLSYSNAGSSVASLQELDRTAAVSIQKRYIDFAEKIGSKYAILHPGTAPFYMVSPLYVQKFKAQIVKSISEIAEYAASKNVKLHVENNTAFDGLFVEPQDCIEIIRASREKSKTEIYFNFDIGHWFTRADKGSPLPEYPVDVMKNIPKDLVCEMHLNDYIPGKIIFHPPLTMTEGPLKGDGLKRYAEHLMKLEPELLLLETAFKTVEQVKNRREIIEQETHYVKEIFGI
ncbi:MAG: sugar phosphate isomerase/epimerase family protein [Elusimicrobiota bacterium]